MDKNNPIFVQLVKSYHDALIVWRGSTQVRHIGRVFHLTERTYCDQYVLLANRDFQTRKPYPFMRELSLADRDAAFEAARKEMP